ncbi:hypothetical protein EDD15DRAFT_2123003, partial [Pisolithus albus]
KDWAKEQLSKVRQGSARTEEFLAKFNALRTASGVSDDYAIFMLERALRPEIVQQIFVQGRRKDTWAEYDVEARCLGAALEAVRIKTGGASSRWGQSFSRPSPGVTSGQGAPMDIGAAQGGSGSRPKKDFSNYQCYACGQKGHIRPHCPQAGDKGKGRQVRSEGVDPRLAAMDGMTFEQIVA